MQVSVFGYGKKFSERKRKWEGWRWWREGWIFWERIMIFWERVNVNMMMGWIVWSGALVMFNGGHRFSVEEKKGVNSRGLIMNYLPRKIYFGKKFDSIYQVLKSIFPEKNSFEVNQYD
jgi:hypothetical protein